MHDTSVLLSEWDWPLYTGSTGDRDARVHRHTQGRVRSTRSGSSTMRRALTQTRPVAGNAYLRLGKGKPYLKTRLAASLAGNWDDKCRSNKLERHEAGTDRDRNERRIFFPHRDPRWYAW